MTDPLSLTEARRLAGTADTLLLRAARSADLETPIGAFLRLDDGVTPAYLLESVEGGERLGRYSFLGVGPRRLLEVRDGLARTTTRPVGVVDYAPDLPVTETRDAGPPGGPARLRAPAPRGSRGGDAALHRRRRWRPLLRRHLRLRAVRAAPGAGPGGRAAGRVHRDGPRARVRPPHPPAVRDRVAPHRGAGPRGPIPDRGARHLRGAGADGDPERGRDGDGHRAPRRWTGRRGAGVRGPRPGRDLARSGRVHRRRGAREGRNRRRRGDPGRPRAPPVVRPPGRTRRPPDRRHRPVPRPSAGQSLAVPVLHPDSVVRGGGRQPGAACSRSWATG